MSGLIAAPFVVWAAVRLTGLEPGWPWVQLVAFTPYVALCGLLVAIALLGLRRWVAGGVAAVAAVALVAVVVPRAVADGGSPQGTALRVLTANLLAGEADERAVLDLAKRLNVDLVAFQEFTPGAERELDAAGIADVLPHRASFPVEGVEGSAVFSRHPLRDPAVRTQKGGFRQARATVELPGGTRVEFESVHPMAPHARATTPLWRQNLDAQQRATPDGPIRVLAGDFNATLDHAALRRLIDSGYRDAASVTGDGWSHTWPYDERWYVPTVALDRVLVDRRVGVRRVETHRTPRSDHKALYAELVIAS
ncbi:endonuclease/exonuclease/phosphatase family protein [Virgisporangium aliadipatigenens]|uniref:endonuclease/exonuclease/phosphatase family protein n=1 Tax=Virgisporangium aliadipatigenens TaxID=741659 RepID=UPI001942CF7A|nr:endonuclease/exonuclease/phosphatase family protein [Virgisporangium aliadipatigenens]